MNFYEFRKNRHSPQATRNFTEKYPQCNIEALSNSSFNRVFPNVSRLQKTTFFSSHMSRDLMLFSLRYIAFNLYILRFLHLYVV